jgi:hypothetical protein
MRASERSPRQRLSAAVAALASDEPPSNDQQLGILGDAFRAYLDARLAGDTCGLDLRNDLPVPGRLLLVDLGFAAETLRRELAYEWTPATFENVAAWRSGLQAIMDATGVDADVAAVDEALRRSGDEGFLSPDEIPNVPPSHWWWWLPHDPPPA